MFVNILFQLNVARMFVAMQLSPSFSVLRLGMNLFFIILLYYSLKCIVDVFCYIKE